MKTYLVTGGAGFIGANFIQALLAEGDSRVINYDKLTYAGNLENLDALRGHPGYRFEKGDIADGRRLLELMRAERPDYVVNFAAESHVDRSIESPGQFIDTNVRGAFELLEASRKHWSALAGEARESFRFLHISTDEVYGSLGDTGQFTEDSPYRPNSPYAASKASSDHLVRAYVQTFGLPALTTNCSNNYGPYQFPEKLIPLMIHNALRGLPLPVYGDGKQVRDWLYVGDHCLALGRVLGSGRVGEVYNIGGGHECANLTLVETLCDLLDELRPMEGGRSHRALIQFVPDRPGHDRRYAIDAGKIERDLGWRPVETFETGLRKTVAWYLDHPGWVERVMSGAYRGERLGLGVKTAEAGHD